MKVAYLAAALPFAWANFYGYTESDCLGIEVPIDNRICNGCVHIPAAPRFYSYRGVDMRSFSLGSHGTCDTFDMGSYPGGSCFNDGRAVAARAYINC
ncbi:hypothetical protein NLG97_g6358 [Lecanicillium saksenae]|uniref:Uncharacterized protein n=1 Tax=Lecanicillium saksenae TaxID=468837 RepID=A0ACC1QQF7_9HYPO|nr:hypothetical protein NLG97_g6358 [Lecanicillium saksenae]